MLRWRNPLLSRSSAERAYYYEKNTSSTQNLTRAGQAARILGWHKRWVGDFTMADRYLLEAERLLEHEDFQSQRIEAMAGRAVVLYSQGRQDSASELTRRALRLLGPNGSVSTRVDLFLVQATILSYSSAFDDALAIVNDAIQLAEESGSRSELSQAFHIRARIFLRMGEVEAAIKPARQAVRIAKSSRSVVMLPYALEVLAAVELERGRYKRSIWLASTAARLGEAQEDLRVTCQSLVIVGKALNRSGDLDAALGVLERGLGIATKISYPLWERWYQLEIANVMEARKDFRAALSAFKAYIEMDQNLFRKETETRMAEMRTKFDLQRAQEMATLERARSGELAKARAIAEMAAQTDHLTGIANRTGLEKHIKAARIAKFAQPFAYVVIDLNRFKSINDTFGHMAGDAVLVDVAARLKSVIRKHDLAARIGGDEFVCIVHDVATPEDASHLGQRLLTAFVDPVHLDEVTLDISVSIGIALSDSVGNDLDQLMTTADQAMYAAKASHTPGFRVYDTDLTNAEMNLNYVGLVRTAIANGEIQPWFQPKINLRTGVLVGFEALARWVTSDGDVLLPGAFIPQIKNHKLGGEFTFAMLRATLRQMKAWKQRGIEIPKVAVNIIEEVLASESARQIVDHILDEYSEFRSSIIFEITEDVLFDRGAGEIRDAIRRLRVGGTRFAMDDFGTGFGSFTHLHQLNMDELKIDMSFVHGIGVDHAAEVIIEGFIYIARGLNMAVTAEGIETKEQAAFLLARGCETGQGFLFSPAISPEDALNQLLSGQAGHLFNA